MTPVMLTDNSGYFAVSTIVVCSLIVGITYGGINLAKQHQNYLNEESKVDFLHEYVNWGSVLVDAIFGTAATTLTMSGASGVTYFTSKVLLSGIRTTIQGVIYNKSLEYIAGTTLKNMGVSALMTASVLKADNIGFVMRNPFIDKFIGDTVSDAAVLTLTLMFTAILSWVGEISAEALIGEIYYTSK